MQPFTVWTGIAAPLDRANVDTDQIIPKQFLKRIERTGFGQFLLLAKDIADMDVGQCERRIDGKGLVEGSERFRILLLLAQGVTEAGVGAGGPWIDLDRLAENGEGLGKLLQLREGDAFGWPAARLRSW